MNVVYNFSVRTQRLKQAKEGAEREAAQYRSHMEDDYQKSLSEVYIKDVAAMKIQKLNKAFSFL